MTGTRQALHRLLGSLGESAQFVTSGRLTPVLPGFEVQGVGSIGTPVSAADAKRLLAKATPAPYGRGEETIVDPKIRRVWQIEPNQFVLRNAAWDAHVTAIVDLVRQEFGIRHKVRAQLYKLLIYKKGSFFAQHRDTEKTPGMFATLVVGLPSRHEGGTLIVQHDGQAKSIDFGGADSEFQTHYAAFYADCQHEITPVTAGYRVCLVYNLAIAGKKAQPSAPQNAAAVERVAGYLRDIFADPSSGPDKIAIPFVHQYTEAGLDLKHLKGADRARADVLMRAAESLNYQCYLALLTHHQSGEADYSTLSFDPFRRRYGRWSDDKDDANNDSGVEMGEVFDEDLTLDHWLDAHGRNPGFGEMHLDEDELLDPGSKEGWSLRQTVHEATGNEGVSMERWYHQGALVIWPREKYFAILAGEGQAMALPVLEQMAARRKTAAGLTECRTFAAAIICHWRPRQRITGGDGSYPRRMLKVLERVGDAELAEQFLRDVLPRDYDGTEGKPLHRLFQRFGWERYGTDLRGFIDRQKPDDYSTRLDQIVSIIEPLCSEAPALTGDRRMVCVSIAEPLANAIKRWDKRQADYGYHRLEHRTGVVPGVIRNFVTISAAEHLDWFLTHVLTDTRHYDLREVLIPDVKAIFKWLPKVPAAQSAASQLLQHCLTELRAATAPALEPPGDWSRDADITCKCEDCRALNQFLRDPGQQVARFPIRKERRQHLHQQIERHHCDCTHVTERVGSPQTLVCTKTHASYERRKLQRAKDEKFLAELEAIAARDQLSKARLPSG